MSYIKPDTPYPAYAQPSMTGNAIIETQHNEKSISGYDYNITINSDVNCLSESD